MFRNVMSETCLNRSVEALDFTVGLVVICSRGRLYNAQRDNECREELGHELQSVFGLQISRNPVCDALAIHKKACCVRRGYCGDWYGPCQFFISVCQDN